jgi:hypothetical protein
MEPNKIISEVEMERSGDIQYYEERAEREIELAQAAKHENAVRAHYELAALYLDLVHGPDAGVSVSPLAAATEDAGHFQADKPSESQPYPSAEIIA